MTITAQQLIQADIALIWRAWTESERITEWFASYAEIEPKLNGKFELYFNPANKSSMSTQGCKIIKLEEPHQLAFQWKGPDPFAEVMNQEDDLTIVEITFEAVESGTLVSLQHSGWKDSEEGLKARNGMCKLGIKCWTA